MPFLISAFLLVLRFLKKTKFLGDERKKFEALANELKAAYCRFFFLISTWS